MSVSILGAGLEADALVLWVSAAGTWGRWGEPSNAYGGWELSLHLQPLATPRGLLPGLLPGPPQACFAWWRRGAVECGAHRPHFPFPPRGTQLCAAPPANSSVRAIRNGYEQVDGRRRPLLAVCTTSQRSRRYSKCVHAFYLK